MHLPAETGVRAAHLGGPVTARVGHLLRADRPARGLLGAVTAAAREHPRGLSGGAEGDVLPR